MNKKDITNKWKPFDTAPRDGTYFLACSTLDEYTCIELMMYYGDMLFNINSGNQSKEFHWTHWMPLPEPPND